MSCHCTQHFYRKGRACYICTECGSDITMELVLLHEIGHSYLPTHEKPYKNGYFKPITN